VMTIEPLAAFDLVNVGPEGITECSFTKNTSVLLTRRVVVGHTKTRALAKDCTTQGGEKKVNNCERGLGTAPMGCKSTGIRHAYLPETTWPGLQKKGTGALGGAHSIPGCSGEVVTRTRKERRTVQKEWQEGVLTPYQDSCLPHVRSAHCEKTSSLQMEEKKKCKQNR